jgi:hypothetical protein
MMREGIIFSGPMVRAILAGRKTQTRRVIKPQPQSEINPVWIEDAEAWQWASTASRQQCPYGQIGDELWVRETWAQGPPLNDGSPSCRIAYRADGRCVGIGSDGVGRSLFVQHGWIQGVADTSLCGTFVGLGRYGGKWRPSIYMPRWASRLTLRLTAVRVERLQDISEDDAIAEGVEVSAGNIKAAELFAETRPDLLRIAPAQQAFCELWDSINSKRGYAWDTNPWVWVLTFEVTK